MTSSILPQQPLAPSDVSLGRLVLNLGAPWQDYCPHFPLELSEKDVSKTPILKLQETLERNRSAKFLAKFSQVLGGSVQAHNRLSASVTALEGSRVFLLNSGDHFERMCSDKKVREWFEVQIKRGNDIYMVVGIIVAKDATVSCSVETVSAARAEIKMPIAEMTVGELADGSKKTAVGSLLNLGTSGGVESQNSITTSYCAPGDRVIGVQYRKVSFRWFSSGKIEKSFLEGGNRWKLYHVPARSPLGSDNENEDVVMADLEDLSTEDIIGLPGERVCSLGNEEEAFVLF